MGGYLEGKIVMCVFDDDAETLEHDGNADGGQQQAIALTGM